MHCNKLDPATTKLSEIRREIRAGGKAFTHRDEMLERQFLHEFKRFMRELHESGGGFEHRQVSHAVHGDPFDKFESLLTLDLVHKNRYWRKMSPQNQRYALHAFPMLTDPAESDPFIPLVRAAPCAEKNRKRKQLSAGVPLKVQTLAANLADLVGLWRRRYTSRAVNDAIHEFSMCVGERNLGRLLKSLARTATEQVSRIVLFEAFEPGDAVSDCVNQYAVQLRDNIVEASAGDAEAVRGILERELEAKRKTAEEAEGHFVDAGVRSSYESALREYAEHCAELAVEECAAAAPSLLREVAGVEFVIRKGMPDASVEAFSDATQKLVDALSAANVTFDRMVEGTHAARSAIVEKIKATKKKAKEIRNELLTAAMGVDVSTRCTAVLIGALENDAPVEALEDATELAQDGGAIELFGRFEQTLTAKIHADIEESALAYVDLIEEALRASRVCQAAALRLRPMEGYHARVAKERTVAKQIVGALASIQPISLRELREPCLKALDVARWAADRPDHWWEIMTWSEVQCGVLPVSIVSCHTSLSLWCVCVCVHRRR